MVKTAHKYRFCRKKNLNQIILFSSELWYKKRATSKFFSIPQFRATDKISIKHGQEKINSMSYTAIFLLLPKNINLMT